MTSLHQPTFTSSLPQHDPHDRAKLGLPPLTVAEEWAEVKKQLAAIVNVLASMAAVATAVWWVGGGRGVGEVSGARGSERQETRARAGRNGVLTMSVVCWVLSLCVAAACAVDGGRVRDRRDRGFPVLALLLGRAPAGQEDQDKGPRVRQAQDDQVDLDLPGGPGFLGPGRGQSDESPVRPVCAAKRRGQVGCCDGLGLARLNTATYNQTPGRKTSPDERTGGFASTEPT